MFLFNTFQTSALDIIPDHPSAMYMRAIAFAIPSSWQSRNRFDAELERIAAKYADDPCLPTLRAIKCRVQGNDGEITYPPKSSDETFGMIAVVAEEGEQAAKAKAAQQALFDQLGLRFSNHLSDDLRNEYLKAVRARRGVFSGALAKENDMDSSSGLYDTNKVRTQQKTTQIKADHSAECHDVPKPTSTTSTFSDGQPAQENDSEKEVQIAESQEISSWMNYFCCSRRNKHSHED